MLKTALPKTFVGLPWYKRLTVVDIARTRLDAIDHVRASLQQACEKNGDTARHKLNLDAPTDTELLFEITKTHRDLASASVALVALSALCWFALYCLFGHAPVFGVSDLTDFMLTEPPEPATLLAVIANGLSGFSMIGAALWLVSCVPPFETDEPRKAYVKRINRAASNTWYVGDKAIYAFSPTTDSVKTVYFDALGSTSHTGPELRRHIAINDRAGNSVLTGMVSFRHDGEPALDFIDKRIATTAPATAPAGKQAA